MNVVEMVQEYLNRGFSQEEIHEFFVNAEMPLYETCDYCSNCNTAILHDDSVDTDPDTGDWLCQDCA